MGLSIALEVARMGARPLVLERRHVGAGSTGKSGAILRQHYSIPVTAAIARDSLGVYADFEQLAGGTAGFVRTGMVLIVDGEHREGLEMNVRLQQKLNIRTEIVEPDVLQELLPDAVVEPSAVGCYEPDAGYADPLETVHTLSEAVRREGGRVREYTEVRDFVMSGNRVTGVRVAGGTITGDLFVAAVGPWARTLLEGAGVTMPVSPVRVQSAVFRRPQALEPGPVIIDFVNEMYAKPAAETHVGSISPAEVEPADPDSYNETVDPGYITLARSRVQRRLPVMERGISFGGYGALYAVTPDWYPVIGPVGVDGLYVCAGFSGHGFKLAPGIGRAVAAELLNLRAPYDLELFRPGRFDAGKPVRGRYTYSILG